MFGVALLRDMGCSLLSGVVGVWFGRGRGECTSVMRVRPRGVAVCSVFPCDCRALLVLGVRVHCSFDNAPIFVSFSSRPRLYVIGV